MKEYNKDFKNSLSYYLPWDYLLEDNIVINNINEENENEGNK